jgi:epoxide hydrolase A/B
MVANASIDDPSRFNHRFETVNGLKMHFVDEGKGPLVILLHGFPFLWYLWRHQIKALAAAGYRVVAPDQRGYGQTEAPRDILGYDMTRLMGDVVGLVKVLGEKSAVLVGQDWGTPVAYFSALVRPDLFRGIFMMCSPPDAWTPVRPSQGRANAPQFANLEFYQEYLGRPTTPAEIMKRLRDFLSGIFYSTSGSCTDAERWNWVWDKGTSFWETFTVPKTLPSYMSQQALDYYVSEFSRNGIEPPINWYRAIEADWDARAFLEGAISKLPASFLTGERDPSLRVLRGIDRQGPAFRSLNVNFPNLKDVIKLPGVGHTPPEEKPEAVNAAILKFLNGL